MELWSLLYEFAVRYGYFGAFIISTVGNFTVVFPVPYAITVYMLGAVLNPLALGVICGLGAAVGNVSAYFVGTLSHKLAESRYGDKLNAVSILLDRYGPIILFVFSALPLPEDLVLILLGMVGYDVFKTVFICFLGKTVMCILLAYAGRYSLIFIKTLFASETGIAGVLAAIALLILITIAVIKLDWMYMVQVVESEGLIGMFKPERIRRLFLGAGEEGKQHEGDR